MELDQTGNIFTSLEIFIIKVRLLQQDIIKQQMDEEPEQWLLFGFNELN